MPGEEIQSQIDEGFVSNALLSGSKRMEGDKSLKQIKSWAVIALTLALVFALAACGGKNEKELVGTWHIVDETSETEYGLGIEFTKDGKLRYGLTEEMLASLIDGNSQDTKDALEGLDMLVSIEYKVKSDTEIEVTVSALLGLAKEKTTVTYELDGDALTFDGVAYTRVK